jgi:hypothetical protein
MSTRFLKLGMMFVLLFACFGFETALEAQTVNVSGKWQISWEARIGTERDILDLQQAGSALTGTFHGRFVTPKVSGNVEGKNITLRFDFPGQKPYSIVFAGAIDGDGVDGSGVDGRKMSGKFEIPGVPGAYDFHGENISSSNYTWSATRVTDGAQSSAADAASKAQSPVARANP